MLLEKPFIQLFQTPMHKYFYEVNRNEIVAISDELFEYLKLQQKGMATKPNMTPCIEEQISELRQAGYLSSHHVSRIEHAYSPYANLFLERKLLKLTLQVTQDCNFRCKYCVYSEDAFLQRSHAKKAMSWELAKKGVDFLLEHSVDSKEVNISFYGGEPLLEFELIRRIVNYANERFVGKKLTFSMTTNATLLTEAITDFIMENNISVLVSLDGPKSINDKNRVFAANNGGTFSSVIKKLEKVKEKHPDFAKNFSVHMVIDPQNEYDEINRISKNKILKMLKIDSSLVDNDLRQKETVFSDHYQEQSIYGAFLGKLCCFGVINKDDLLELPKQECEFFDHIVSAFSSAPLQDVFAPSGPCIPGQARLFMNCDGDLFPCERVSELCPSVKIGSATDGFDLKRVYDFLNVAQLTENECKNCWAFTQCNVCGKCAQSDSGFSASEKLKHCDRSIDNAVNNVRSVILSREVEKYFKKQLRLEGNSNEN